ncbi:MAG: PKD domain-containing protein [Actinomycetaceae bacterium]|nr:PKD domain-containing protein [Actinomycetaceae bacterium]
MLFVILSFALIPLSVENPDVGENRPWIGNMHSSTNSVVVTGTMVQVDFSRAIPRKLAGKQKTPAEEEYESFMSDVDMHLRVYVDGDSSGLVSISDVASLGIDGGGINLQPSRGWAYVNKPVYLQSSAQRLVKETEILGSAVTITAEPVSFTWHCGNGESFTTKDPGGSWPNGKVTYTYTRPGTYTLSADITWRASYTVDGNTYPVDGTLTTTSTVQTIELREAEAVLTY